jgi:hypothetical protein
MVCFGGAVCVPNIVPPTAAAGIPTSAATFHQLDTPNLIEVPNQDDTGYNLPMHRQRV